jgi:hypothetical protein
MNPEPTKDFRDFVALLNRHKVKYVLIGGYAVAFHGHPRFTKDVDFLVERSRENAEALLSVLADFGFQSLGFTSDDLLVEDTGFYLGNPPYRIDVLNCAPGITFQEAWESRIEAEIAGVTCQVLSRELLIRSKRASGRPTDLDDADKIERRQ